MYGVLLEAVACVFNKFKLVHEYSIVSRPWLIPGSLAKYNVITKTVRGNFQFAKFATLYHRTITFRGVMVNKY
jgi:hypothetical protein